MQPEHFQRGDCPWCGEPLELLVDPQALGQSYIEDCQVCCRPILVRVHMDVLGDGSTSLELSRDD
jgi:hypothetical protein